MNDTALQAEIDAKAVAPRIKPTDIEDNIVSETYFTAADGFAWANQCTLEDDHPLHLLTFCVLTLRNGFTVTGESACASPENFDAEIGQKVARENAINKMWPLMGYELKGRLYRIEQLRKQVGA